MPYPWVRCLDALDAAAASLRTAGPFSLVQNNSAEKKAREPQVRDLNGRARDGWPHGSPLRLQMRRAPCPSSRASRAPPQCRHVMVPFSAPLSSSRDLQRHLDFSPVRASGRAVHEARLWLYLSASPAAASFLLAGK